MAANPEAQAEPAELVLKLTRLIDAPPALLFKVWSQPEHLVRWWGPGGFTLPTCEMDFRPGGGFRFVMRSAEGSDHQLEGTYHEIVEPERLVFSWRWTGGDCEDPLETVVTVTFEEEDGKTRLNLHQALFDTVETRDAHEGGWSESLDRLEAYAGGL